MKRFLIAAVLVGGCVSNGPTDAEQIGAAYVEANVEVPCRYAWPELYAGPTSWGGCAEVCAHQVPGVTTPDAWLGCDSAYVVVVNGVRGACRPANARVGTELTRKVVWGLCVE